MKFLLLIPVILFPFSLFADLNKGVVEHIEWADRLLNHQGPCEACEEEKESRPSQDVAELCMTQVCGPAAKYEDSLELLLKSFKNPRTTLLYQLAMKNLNQKLEESADQIDRSRKAWLDLYDQVSSSGELKVDPKYRKFHAITELLNYLSQSSLEAGPDPLHPVVINKEETYRNFSDLPSDKRAWLVNNLDRFLDSSVGGEIVLGSMTSPKDFLKLTHPKMDLKEAFQVEAQEVLKQVRALKADPICSKISGIQDYLKEDLVRKAMNGEDLSASEMDKFMEIKMDSNLLSKLISKDQSLISDPSFDLTADIDLKGFKKQIEEYKRDLANPQKLRAARDEVIENCRTNFIFQLATLPDKDQLQMARENGNWAKSRIKTALGRVLSEQTKKALNSKIDDAFFSFPQDRSHFGNYFFKKLDSSSSQVKSLDQDFEKLKSDLSRGIQDVLLTIRQSPEEYTLKKHYDDLQGACDQFKIKMTSDTAYTSTGGINTSWVSVQRPEMGREIMLHELGHLAFSTLNSDKVSEKSQRIFEDAKKCLESNHLEEGIPKDFRDNEDWADLMAGIAGIKGKNFGCLLSLQEDNRYQNLSFQNTDKEDSHSSSFFRTLHIYRLKNGELPSSCKQYISALNPKPEIKACLPSNPLKDL